MSTQTPAARTIGGEDRGRWTKSGDGWTIRARPAAYLPPEPRRGEVGDSSVAASLA